MQEKTGPLGIAEPLAALDITVVFRVLAYNMKNQDNETALQAMKETMPQTYEYLTKLVSAEPFLNEKYFLDTVSR